MIDATSPSFDRPRSDSARRVESLLWLAAGAAWAMVALKAWNESRKLEARRRTFSISERILKQVFSRPHDAPRA